MQPASAIPPYDPERLETLVGMRCAVPRLSNRYRVWWVRISKVEYVNQVKAVVRLVGGKAFGRPKHYELSDVRFKNHSNDPLVIAVIKGRENLTSPRKPRSRPASSP